MALRQLNLGEDTHFVFALAHHLITETRSRAMSGSHQFENANPGKLEPVNFYDLHRPETDERFRTAHRLVNNSSVVFPENFLLYDWQVDKVVVVADSEKPEGNGRLRKRVAIVILRNRDYVFSTQDQVRRYRVTLTDYFAENNNRWPKDPMIEELGEYDPFEAETQKALASI